MLLCVGDPEDLTAVYIGWLAQQRGIDAVSLAEQDYGVHWWMSADEATGDVQIVCDGRPLDIRDVTGVFVRFNPEPALPAGWSLSEAAYELFVQERRVALTELLEHLPVPLVNRPSAGRSNGAKPLHMAHLARLGLRVPEWIATNDGAAARRFLDLHPEGAVVKSSSGLRCHVRLADDEYLRRIEEGSTPSVLQQFIAGGEVRVHAVGARVFGARIHSADVDYRFSETDVQYRRETVPHEIAGLCVHAAGSDGLTLAGFDFRVDEHDRWWCLEMNPVPTFLPYEAATGLAIGDAILDWMESRPTPMRTESLLAALVHDAG